MFTSSPKREIRGRPFNFWGGDGYRWFQKKISYRLNSRGKNSCKEIYLAKKKILHWKNISLMVNNVGKKSYMSGKKTESTYYLCNSITQSKSLIPPLPLPQKSNGRPLKHFYVVVVQRQQRNVQKRDAHAVIVLPIEAPWKRTQHCWPTIPNIFGNCCARLHANSLTGFKLWATTPKNATECGKGRDI